MNAVPLDWSTIHTTKGKLPLEVCFIQSETIKKRPDRVNGDMAPAYPSIEECCVFYRGDDNCLSKPGRVQDREACESFN